MAEQANSPLATRNSLVFDIVSDPRKPLRVGAAGHGSLLERIRELALESTAVHFDGSRAVMRRFRDNVVRLADAHRKLSRRAIRNEPVPPESEWLLDNYYIIEEVVREIKLDLPRGFYGELPALQAGDFAGLPRLHPLALTLLAYTDSALGEADIREAAREFQKIAPFTIGEIWALPALLRLALVENLRRLADRIVATVEDQRAAAAALDQFDRRRTPRLPAQPSDAFAVAFWEGLRDGDNSADLSAEPIRDWAAAHLADPALIQHREYCRQAADQVTIGNAVTTLRLIGAIDWMLFFESVSLVEAELRDDPGRVYSRQDFPTRDRCRKAVEELAMGSGAGELEVAQLANRRAAENVGDPARFYAAWYLLGEGRTELAAALKERPRWSVAQLRWRLNHPYTVYFAPLAAVSLLITGLVMAAVLTAGGSFPAALAAGLLVLLPASELAVGFTNVLLSRLVPPRVLPKYEFKSGIGEGSETFVAMPTLVDSPAQAAALCERLEQHYLSNPDPRLHFALLADPIDAAAETMPGDAAWLAAARAGVRRLNELYAPGAAPRFFLMARKRLWNLAENCWMAWERKRGKLDEFNRLLRGGAGTSFSLVEPPLDGLPPLRYVLTLDADTVLPRDAARLMVATLAHPLNAPVPADGGRRIGRGYAILQPRVSFLYKTGFRSLFAKLYAGSAGIDPYSAATSDTYMDLFGRGTFTGKGLYDIDAFQAVAGRTFPENAILSHDLIESDFARCALATDIEVFDEFPSRYNAYAKRDHRWIRGDWQLLAWLGRRVPTAEGRAANVLPLLERWKIADNLRRSLVPPALVAGVIAWGIFGGPLAWVGAAFALAVAAWPALVFVSQSLPRGFTRAARRGLREKLSTDLPSTLGQAGLQLAFLANQACISVDAIARTLYRLAVSRKNLLQWETAAAAEKRLGADRAGFLRSMLPALAVAAVGFLAIALLNPHALFWVGPLLLLWLASPEIAYRVSLPRVPREIVLSEAEKLELRLVCRKTWNFFDTFVGPADHHLPPDNFQEEPLGAVAHRTSPTNIGLYLLSVLAAHDLGYIAEPELVDRLRKAFESMDKLERPRGHFVNWYETSTLQTLQPSYVSTVDSGNLLGCLLALKQGLIEKARTPAAPVVAGLCDTLEVLRRAAAAEAAPSPAATAAFAELQKALEGGENLVRIGELIDELRATLPAGAQAQQWADRLRDQAKAQARAATQTAEFAGQWARDLNRLAEEADRFAREMDFRFLYNSARDLFSIGFNFVTGRLDPSHYDLLASESCITSFLAVARGEAPRKHWFQLGRLTAQSPVGPGLLSWGGTMFEYLMPRILLPVPPGVLLDRAQRAAVARQIEYGGQVGLPWGVSESGFYLLDAGKVYQYQSFGVPGLGLKRGLERDRVVAPYATLMAVDTAPHAAIANLKALREFGAEGAYGFHEALDFTPSRLEADGRCQVVRSYMAHHQGMAFLAIVNRLSGGVMRNRFRAEPLVRSAELLLEERVPIDTSPIEANSPHTEELHLAGAEAPSRRRITTPDTPAPRTHLLSNGHYTVMVTNAGGGFSRCGEYDITHFRADRTADACGQFLYLRDRKTNRVWSAAHQPTRARPEVYEVTYSLDKADFRQFSDGLEMLMEIVVPPDQDVEIRRLTVTNHGLRSRHLDATSYAELVLNTHAADLAHPVFGKLFLETEWLPQHGALLCRRRPREPEQAPLYAIHGLVAADGLGVVSYETDRRKFLGRRRTAADPAALAADCEDLSGTTGPVLDPVFAVRREFRLRPGESTTLAFVTGFAASREAAITLADHYSTAPAITRGFELAWAHARIQMQHSGLRPEEIHLFQRLAGHLMFPNGPLRANPASLLANVEGQPGLWRFGISGDLPILLLRLHGEAGLPLLRQLLQAHTFWRAKSLRIDFVVLCENAAGYQDALHDEALGTVRWAGLGEWLDRPAGVFVRKGGQTAEADRTILLSAARATLDDREGPLAAQVDNPEPVRPIPARRPAVAAVPAPRFGPLEKARKVLYPNQTGAFTADGLEYHIAPETPDRLPPHPWCNVVANPDFGFMATDSGGGYTWAGNSQKNRLTPWSNDPVSDPPGDVVYIQSEATGALWCPTPLPVRDDGPVLVRHGQGYSAFERTVNDIQQTLTVSVPTDDPVKISVLRLKNAGAKPAVLTLAYYVEWVLGTNREATSPYIVVDRDADCGALFARNAFTGNPHPPTAFAALGLPELTVTGDRTEFLGRNGSPAAPASFGSVGLSGRTGPGLDPCAALRGTITLAPKEEREIVFLLGEAADPAAARRLVKQYLDPVRAEAALEGAVTRWDQICGTIQVRTPDPAFDLMVNRWLPYQVLSCRFWGRSAFYQSGGAFGFRDQLQDVAALVHAAPDIARAHILRAAAHQFAEGDVQHWWHEPTGEGVRTRFSDDFLWLVYVACHYSKVTGDTGIFDESVHYLTSPVLADAEKERYEVPRVSDEAGSVYDHCVRALKHGWRLGAHGLPLMGGGDWNDGMNTVGIGGRGESVWVAWFQIACLREFAEVAERRGDAGYADEARRHLELLREAIEAHAFDGGWYLRAFFDDGTPLGSKDNAECRIDSIVQSWAVISGAADPSRARRGMDAAVEHLLKPADRLALLFDPPFDKGPAQPGYIKGYLPGVRENGGQYTHASTWMVKALAMLGRGDSAQQVFGILNPVKSTLTAEDVRKYGGEPYAVAADVYGCPPLVGHAGWTWYTGSAAWLYRVALEDILGFERMDNRLRLKPCLPADWSEVALTWHFGKSVYAIRIVNVGSPLAARRVTLDGREVPEGDIPLVDDGQPHEIVVEPVGLTGVAANSNAGRPRTEKGSGAVPAG